MKLKDIEQLFHNQLDDVFGKNEVAQFFYLCIEHFYELSRLDLALDHNISITSEEQPLIFDALEQLKQQKPIQYILGHTEFYGLAFKVNNNTLIPRPETEELVDLILNDNKEKTKDEKAKTILDIGTGTGCIAISLAKKIEDAKVSALDISAEAIQMAKQNAELNKVAIHFIEASILDQENWASNFSNLKFDVIVSNPPYVRHLEKIDIKSNVLEHEPHLALFVENDNPLQFYKAITEFAELHLNKNGFLYFEINEYLAKEMIDLVSKYQFKNVEVIKDIFGKNRMLKAKIIG